MSESEFHTHKHHHEHIRQISSLNRVFIFSIALNLLFVAIEATIGLVENSLSLLSDAGHNLSDVFSLVLVLVAFKLSKLQNNKHFTYGYKKSTVLISLLNAIILLVAIGAIVAESIHKFQNPTPINGAVISWVAGIGILINGATALLLMHGQRNDINVRGAFLHMAADTLVSIGVLVSGIVISYTGWNLLDPIISMVIALVIFISTLHLLSNSLRLSLDGMPEGIDFDKICKTLKDNNHVIGVHHVHIWAISTTSNALTAHVVLDDIRVLEEVKTILKKELIHADIDHSTLEFEEKSAHCEEFSYL